MQVRAYNKLRNALEYENRNKELRWKREMYT